MMLLQLGNSVHFLLFYDEQVNALFDVYETVLVGIVEGVDHNNEVMCDVQLVEEKGKYDHVVQELRIFFVR